MNSNLIKIVCCIIFLGNSFLTFSQDKIKFGYHDASGKVIDLQQITKKKVSDSVIVDLDTIISSIDSTFVVNFDTINEISSDSIFSEFNDTLSISVLLPFYLEKNIDFQKEYSRSSKYSLSFLEGIIFAIDSLSLLGIPIKLNVFDTENNPDVVSDIAKKDVVKESNILFGPLYPNNFRLISNFYRSDTNKIIINPLSKTYGLLRKNKNVYFLTPSLNYQADLISQFLKGLDNSTSTFFVKYLPESKKMPNYINKHNLDTIFKRFIVKEFNVLSKINKSSFSFLDVDNNFLLLWSEEESFINRFISFLGTVKYPVSLFTFRFLEEFDRIDIETLMKLNLHVPVSNYFDNYSKENKNLQNKFENFYYHKMDENSRLSFFSILHFCTNHKQYDFVQLYEGGGFINTDVKICVYKDYKLLPIE